MVYNTSWKKWKEVLERPGIWIHFFGGNHVPADQNVFLS